MIVRGELIGVLPLALVLAVAGEDILLLPYQLRRAHDRRRRVGIIRQLLKSTPVLDARTASLRIEKTAQSEMAKLMNQAVTAAEYLEAAVNSKDAFETFPLPYELKKSVA